MSKLADYFGPIRLWQYLLLVGYWLNASWLMAQTRPVFPLAVSSNGRYFVDQLGKPFLYQADTGWQLFARLTLPEVREYLMLRQRQGFNAIQVQISMNPDSLDRAGNRALKNDDFGQPNEAYFMHVERCIQLADSLDLLLNIAPFWIGCCKEGYGIGGNEVYRKNGTINARRMGEYLGKRFGGYANLLWTMGGDNDPRSIRLEIEAFAEGLRATAPRQLITYHAATPHSSTDLFQYAPWLGYSMIYTYWREKPRKTDPQQMLHVYEAALREYNKSDRVPFILGEAQYEGDGLRLNNDFGTAQQMRRQAWWTMLCGGAGHAYGHEGWDFPAYSRADSARWGRGYHWRAAMRHPGGSLHLRYVRELLETLPWWRLVPDQRHNALVLGYGDYTRPNYVTAALTDDNSLLIAYLPEPGTVAIDLGQLTGPQVRLRWYDPRTGQFVRTETVSNRGVMRFTSPFRDDWVLLAQSVSQ